MGINTSNTSLGPNKFCFFIGHQSKGVIKVCQFKIQEEIHHYLDTVHKILTIVMMPHTVRTSCKACATATVHSLCEYLLPKKTTYQKPANRKVAFRSCKSMEFPGMDQKMEQVKEQQESFLSLCLSWNFCKYGNWKPFTHLRAVVHSFLGFDHKYKARS